ncbi:hypothetical protein CKAH01_01687 [Colletotrichum kahawae]|uniref:Uncharacterized protein n=1 Tax=Colletotrichum kahawae TaxID=34407 RepID=A0AAD9Y4A7_COLKA|nr:hypothetical protein CKAH01_01687 [Colletotrichum kahawae]
MPAIIADFGPAELIQVEKGKPIPSRSSGAETEDHNRGRGPTRKDNTTPETETTEGGQAPVFKPTAYTWCSDDMNQTQSSSFLRGRVVGFGSGMSSTVRSTTTWHTLPPPIRISGSGGTSLVGAGECTKSARPGHRPAQPSPPTQSRLPGTFPGGKDPEQQLVPSVNINLPDLNAEPGDNPTAPQRHVGFAEIQFSGGGGTT